MIPLILIAAITSALGRRMAGGLLSQWVGLDLGDASVRLLWGVILSANACAAGLAWPHALAVVPLVWAGSTVGYWDAMLPRSWRDAAVLTLHGLGGTAALAAGAYALGLAWWWPLMAGLLCAPCYAMAMVLPMQAPWLGCYRVDPPPTAELAWGACVGVSVVLTLF